MATTQSEIEGPFTPSIDESEDSETDNVEDYSGEVDILGCGVENCDATFASISQLKWHYIGAHHGNGGFEQLKQHKFCSIFNSSRDDNDIFREKATKLNMPF